MTILISPVLQTKEQWLEQNGELVDISSPSSHPNELKLKDRALVCIVRNFLSTVAVVVPNDHFYNLYTSVGEDRRDKKWYSVPFKKLTNPTEVKLTPNWETFYAQ